MGERFYGVQALRFAAATAVVVTHAVDLAGTRGAGDGAGRRDAGELRGARRPE